MTSDRVEQSAAWQERHPQLGRAIVSLIVCAIGLNVVRVVLHWFVDAGLIQSEYRDPIYSTIAGLALLYNGVLLYRVGDRLLNVLYVITALVFFLSQPGLVPLLRTEFLTQSRPIADVGAFVLLGTLFYRIVILLMVADQQRQQKLLEHLVLGTSHRVGSDFLAGLVSTIVETMSVEIALVSELDADQRLERVVSSAATTGRELPLEFEPGMVVDCSSQSLQTMLQNRFLYRVNLTNAENKTIGHLCLIHDPSEKISPGQQSSLQIFASRAAAELLRLQADKKSEAMEARMHQVQKLESLGVLAGGIAHDFNNLLQAIQGYTTLADDTLSPDSPSHAAISRIDQVVSKGAAMCDRLLDYAGRSVRRHIVCDLNQLLTEAADIVRSGRPGCVVTVERSEQPLHVWGDAAQLSQVLINLLTNAADAVEGGSGEIYASTHMGRASNTISDGLRLDDTQEYAFIQVSDNGCGIADDTKSKLFDPFFTTKGDGRGIGLAAVSGIVKSHQGDITFTSKLGTGTTFVVAIPLTEEPLEIAVCDHEAPESAPGLRVLAVDDDEMVLNTTQLLLESANIDVTTANSGQNALDLIEQSGDSFHVVLLDQTMPGMSGLETCEVMRTRGVRAPFILMSGYCKIDTAAELEKITRLSKPYSRQELLSAIAEATEPLLDVEVSAPV